MVYKDTNSSCCDRKMPTIPNNGKKLTLCMIVKNEEKFLERCLKSVVDIVDEIVIVDTGSTDGTVKIAETFGAKIYHFTWTGDFSEARNKALEYVTGDWVLQLDADEELAEDNKYIIRQLMLRDDPVGYLLKIVNFIDCPDGNREIMEHYAIRIFPKHPDIFYRQPIHEQISYRVECLSGDFTVLPLDRVFSPLTIYHHGYHKQLVKDRKKSDRNTKILKDILNKDKQNAFQHFNLGLALGEEERYEEALEEYLTAARLEKPDISYYPMILIYASHLSAKLGRYDEALKHALRAVELAPKLPDAAYVLGEAYRYAGKTDEAIRQYKKAMQIYKEQNEEEYNVISDPGTGTWKPLNQIGSIYFQLGKLEESQEHLEKALSIKPDSLCVLHNLGNLYLKCAIIEKAEECFNRAYNISWKSSYQELFNCYLLQNKWAAVNNLLSELQKKLSLIDWLALEAKTAIQVQNWPRAQVALETLVSQKPSAIYYNELGMIYVREGWTKEGANAYKEAIKLEPSFAPARFNLAKLLFSEGDKEKALSCLEQISINDSSVGLPANILRAHILALMNKINESNNLLLELNKLHPESQETVLLLCDNLIKIKADDTAYELLSMIQPHQKENPEFLLKHGLIALRLKKYDEAKKLLSDAQKLSHSSEIIKIVQDALTYLNEHFQTVLTK